MSAFRGYTADNLVIDRPGDEAFEQRIETYPASAATFALAQDRYHPSRYSSSPLLPSERTNLRTGSGF